MKRTVLFAGALIAAASVAGAQESNPNDEERQRECTLLYEGESSRFGYCDDGSVQWALPKDAFRIDKVFSPGPNSIVKAPERAVRENFRGLKRAFKRLGF